MEIFIYYENMIRKHLTGDITDFMETANKFFCKMSRKKNKGKWKTSLRKTRFQSSDKKFW